MKGEPIVILLVEDDPAHTEIIKRTFEESRLANRLISVEDGQEALDVFKRDDKFNWQAIFAVPAAIMLASIVALVVLFKG